MTDEELDRLQALADTATRPPWTRHSAEGIARLRDLLGQPYVPDGATCVLERLPQSRTEAMESFGEVAFVGFATPEDVAFMAAARQAVPELIAEVRRLRAEWDKICTSFHAMNTPSGRELELAEEVRRLREQLRDDQDNRL